MKKLLSMLAIMMMASTAWADAMANDKSVDTLDESATSLGYCPLGKPYIKGDLIMANELTWKYEAVFNYYSLDEKGEKIELSARMIWPRMNKNYINDVVLLCPYTHCSDAECASVSEGATTGMEGKTMMNNYWLIIPDGEGFGASKDRTQLYLNHEVWARQEMDCLRAAWYLYDSLKVAGKPHPAIADEWGTVIAGTSQGAGTALATLRFMETNWDKSDNDSIRLDNKFNVKFANICCGPYDPVVTVKTYFQEWHRLTYPCVIPMVLKSMILSYPEIMGGYKEEDFYTPEYLAIKPQIDAALASKKKTAGEVNDIIFAAFSHSKTSPGLGGNGGAWITEFLRSDVIDLSSEQAQRLVRCLEKNNVLDGKWTPEHFIKYYCSTGDAVVPYANSEKLATFLKTGNYSCKTGTDNHVAACGVWTLTNPLIVKEYDK